MHPDHQPLSTGAPAPVSTLDITPLLPTLPTLHVGDLDTYRNIEDREAVVERTKVALINAGELHKLAAFEAAMATSQSFEETLRIVRLFVTPDASLDTFENPTIDVADLHLWENHDDRDILIERAIQALVQADLQVQASILMSELRTSHSFEQTMCIVRSHVTFDSTDYDRHIFDPATMAADLAALG